MINLKKLLEKKGLASFDDLVKYCGDGFFEELDRMIDNREVSVHIESMGEKKYRYPYYAVRVIGQRLDKSIKVLKLIQEHPGLNAASIKKTLKISQSAFERMESELLESGQVTRTKKGAAWIYSVNGVDPVEAPSSVAGAWAVLGAYWERTGWSIQKIAKEAAISRDSVSAGVDWLTEQGILVNETLEGFWSMSVEERKAWLRKHFAVVIQGELDQDDDLEAEIAFYAKTPESVVQPKPLAQPLSKKKIRV